MVEIDWAYSLSKGNLRAIRVYDGDKRRWPLLRQKPLVSIVSDDTDIDAAEALVNYFKYLKQESEKEEKTTA